MNMLAIDPALADAPAADPEAQAAEAAPEPDTEATPEAPAPPKPEPFDIVKAVEKFIADTIEHAEGDEDAIAAKVVKQRSAVARLNIAMLRIDQGKKEVKEKLEEAVGLLDSMERDSQREAQRLRDEPLLPFRESESDAWKAVTLEDLGIKTARVLKALHEHTPPITTHGELAAWQEAKGDFWAKDVAGLGAKGREEIENAQFAWWDAHPETNRAKPAEESAPAAGDQ